jgi:NAD(P)H-quinone oxidoreductase subunit 5
MKESLPWLLLALPVLPLVAGLLARKLTPAAAVRCVAAGALGALLAAAACAVGLASTGPFAARLLPIDAGSGFAVSLRMDLVAAVMSVLVAFLGGVVIRYSGRYLAGDPRQSVFCSWMSLALGSVLLLMVSGNLLLLLAAWVATSLCLHRLLLHCPGRAGAVFSARKKFVVSRLGDLLLLAAVVLLRRDYGTWELDAVFAQVAAGTTAPLAAICPLLAGCAALKSAQFPFHGWLPDTMETPTPVSAFMHAGIINAGGFLVIRTAPLFVHSPGALAFLAVLGSITAAFGAAVMLAQPSVKRALAYSTIAQMGFMLLQCGLGAFGLALLHIVAHSLYKAHAFLSSGSTVEAFPRAAVRLRTPALACGVLTGGLVVAGAGAMLALLAPAHADSQGVFGLVLALALAYGLARVWSVGATLGTVLKGAAVAALLGGAGLALHWGVDTGLAQLPRARPAPTLVIWVGAVFSCLFLFQALLWRTGHHALGRALYVHALNGFYVGTWGNRILGRLWPRRSHL